MRKQRAITTRWCSSLTLSRVDTDSSTDRIQRVFKKPILAVHLATHHSSDCSESRKPCCCFWIVACAQSRISLLRSNYWSSNLLIRFSTYKKCRSPDPLGTFTFRTRSYETGLRMHLAAKVRDRLLLVFAGARLATVGRGRSKACRLLLFTLTGRYVTS